VLQHRLGPLVDLVVGSFQQQRIRRATLGGHPLITRSRIAFRPEVLIILRSRVQVPPALQVPTHWGEHFLNGYASRLTAHSLEANFQARPGHSASTLILMNFTR
jgi:hypothetical protein